MSRINTPYILIPQGTRLLVTLEDQSQAFVTTDEDLIAEVQGQPAFSIGALEPAVWVEGQGFAPASAVGAAA